MRDFGSAVSGNVHGRGVGKLRKPSGEPKPRASIGLDNVGWGAACVAGPVDTLDTYKRGYADFYAVAGRFDFEPTSGHPNGLGNRGAGRLRGGIIAQPIGNREHGGAGVGEGNGTLHRARVYRSIS